MTEPRTIEQSREAGKKVGIAEERHILVAHLNRQNDPIDFDEDAIGGAGIGEGEESPTPANAVMDPLNSGCGFMPGEGI